MRRIMFAADARWVVRIVPAHHKAGNSHFQGQKDDGYCVRRASACFIGALVTSHRNRSPKQEAKRKPEPVIHKDQVRIILIWCEKRDLNPYGVNHTPLKRARLPVPPLSLILIAIQPPRRWLCNESIIPHFRDLSILFPKNTRHFQKVRTGVPGKGGGACGGRLYRTESGL